MDYIGQKLRLSIFGGSHEPAIGMTLDGFPVGEAVDPAALADFLARRRPGQAAWSSPRRESDEPVFLSGLTDGVSDGLPITARIANRDICPTDYTTLRSIPRPGHADFAAWVKTGAIPTGGGAYSGRMTAALCVAGGICLQYLQRRGIRVLSRISELGGIADKGDFSADSHPGTFPTLDEACGEAMKAAIARVKAEGDSLGGVVECAVFGVEAGIGGPLFEGLEGRISALLYAIPAVKAVEFGDGFTSARLRGSENNDPFVLRDGRVETETNRCGGLLGGVTDGMPLVFRAFFKPTPSIAKPQRSVDLAAWCETTVSIPGRHDPCIVPRALPCVESDAAIALCDALICREESGSELSALRARIDRVDADLLRLFEERMALCEQIGAYKRSHALPVADPGREEEKLKAAEKRASRELAAYDRALLDELMALSRRRQHELREREAEV